MSETTAEPLAEVTADATPAPTIDDTMSATFDAIEAREKGEDVAVEPEAAEPPASQTRGPDGKFVAAEPGTEAPAEPAQPGAESPTAPVVPDYIAPYQADFAMRGLSPEQAIPILVDTWRNIERNPQMGIAELAGRYGLKVNFGDVPTQAQPQAEAPAGDQWVDPQIAALQQKLDALIQKDQQREQMTQAQQEAAYREAYGSVNAEIQTFAKTKAAAEGINFDLLRPKMAALIGSGEAKDLEDAYEQAVYANPTTRAIRIAAERKQSEAKTVAETTAKAQAARRAGVINVRADTGTPARGRTMDETMARAYDEIAARG